MRVMSAECDGRYVRRQRPQFIENLLNWLKLADPFGVRQSALVCALAHRVGV
jgi:hypothetical protein